jgi:capsular exopolysaccharide synthesis family protein
MSRITEALRRARTGSDPAPTEDDRQGASIQFFAPGQAAIVSPWDIREEPVDQSSAAERRPVLHEELSSAALSRCNPDLADRAQGPSGPHQEKLVVSSSMSPVIRAQYGKLAAALHQAQVERGVKVLTLISPAAAEGKTLTAANLALTFSEGYRRRVLLIDADLRRPMIHEVYGIANTRGLGQMLGSDSAPPLVRVNPLLWVLPAGEKVQGEPSKILTSDNLQAFIDEARVKFDWILVDTPPIGLVPDARLLSPLTDGTLMITRAGKTPYDEVKMIAETFDPRLLLGVVLNHVDDSVLQQTPEQYYD